MDKIDYQIIKELSKDSRVSAKEIASKIYANERTVSRRINKLMDEGTIKTTVIVDPGLFGYKSIADINLYVSEEIYDDFVEECKNNPHVCYIAIGWGQANLSIETRFKDNESMFAYINHELKHKPGVEVINYFIIPKIIYNINQWLPQASDFDE